MTDGVGIVDNTRIEGSFPSPHGVPETKSIADAPPENREQNEVMPPAKMEIITKEDIEIRKIHALRKQKEFLEQKLVEAEEKKLYGSDFEVPESEKLAVYSAQAANAAITKDIAELDDGGDPNNNDLSFKTDDAISKYKTYKKETPKPWDSGLDVNEIR